MKTKEAINQRFIICITSLLNDKKDLNKGKIGKKLGLQPSKFSEILKGRMNVGTDTVAIFCEEFNFSGDWILTGNGKMQSENESVSVNENNNLVERQEKFIDQLQSQIHYLSEKLAECEGRKRANAG